MDGVLFRGRNFWLDLHTKMGTQAFALDLWERYGHSDYRRLSELTAQRWKGRDASVYHTMCKRRPVMPGTNELFAYARKKEFVTAIISSGPWHLARRAQQKWGIDHIFANKLSFTKDGRFGGSGDVQVDDNSKDDVLKRLQSDLAIRPSETIVIGDSKADARMADLSSCSIGYNVGDEQNERDLDFFAESHLGNVMPHVRGCVAKTKAYAAG